MKPKLRIFGKGKYKLIANRRLAELLSGCVQRGKQALSSALPGRPRTCQRLGQAIACIQTSTAGSWWLWTTAEALLFFRFSHQTHCWKELVSNCFGFVNETRNGEMAGVQSWPKCWLSGSCLRAQCQRWWTMNICHSVVSCLMFKTKVSLKRRCFQQCLELENLIKYDAGWYIFFVAMLNWILHLSIVQVDNWHWFRGSSRPSV